MLFAALSRADKKTLLDLFFPNFSDYVLAGWESYIHRPYETVTYRSGLGLRAPNRPEWHLTSRTNYIQRAAEALIYFR
ncbi:MAG: hypothetical protein AAF633_23580, partial [Chloroflexota bacterium]